MEKGEKSFEEKWESFSFWYMIHYESRSKELPSCRQYLPVSRNYGTARELWWKGFDVCDMYENTLGYPITKLIKFYLLSWICYSWKVYYIFIDIFWNHRFIWNTAFMLTRFRPAGPSHVYKLSSILFQWSFIYLQYFIINLLKKYYLVIVICISITL